MRREQGITRAGNAHVRRVMVQLAWTWVRYQPTSALPCGISNDSPGVARERDASALSPSHANSWWRCGTT